MDSSNGRTRLNEKVVIFLLCLILATFFWFLSSLSMIYSTTLEFPLKYSEVSEELVLIESPQNSLTLWVTGSGFDLLAEQLALSKQVLMVDIEKSRSSNRSGRYYILSRNLRDNILSQLDNELNLDNIYPDTLFFETLPRKSKEVPVTVVHDISYDKQISSSGDILVKPDKVTLSGPSNYIDTVSTIYTDSLQLKNIKDTIFQKLKLKYPDEIVGVNAEPNEVQVTIPAERFTEGRITLPIKVTGSDTTDIRIFPSDVVVTYLVPISKFDLVNSEMFVIEIKTDKEKLLNKKLKVEISHAPNFIEVVRLKPERVEFIIRK